MANHIHDQLVANQVYIAQLEDDFSAVQIVNRDGSAEIFVSVDDDPNPTVNGDCAMLPASVCILTLEATGNGATKVKLKSTGTPKFSVWGVRGDG